MMENRTFSPVDIANSEKENAFLLPKRHIDYRFDHLYGLLALEFCHAQLQVYENWFKAETRLFYIYVFQYV